MAEEKKSTEKEKKQEETTDEIIEVKKQNETLKIKLSFYNWKIFLLNYIQTNVYK